MLDNQKQIFTREENLGNIGTLKVTKNLQQIIDRLHYKIGATEWSGILFYKLTSGNITNLKNLEFTADFLYPMNIGSSVYTEFDYNGEIINAYDVFEEGVEQSTGLIHSHHNMSTFFSGVDQTELKDNASQYNYYISLIVNFAHEYCAKIAFPSKTNVVSESWIKDNNGKLFKKKIVKEENSILIGDLKVIIEDDTIAPEWLNNRIKALEDKKKASVVVTPNPINSFNYNPAFTRSKNYYDGFDFDERMWPETSTQKHFINKPNITRASQFLAGLIYQDASKTSSSIEKGLKELFDLKEDELAILEENIDNLLPLLHEQIYGANSDISITKHCLEAMLELSEYEVEYGSTIGYEIINQALGVYAI